MNKPRRVVALLLAGLAIASAPARVHAASPAVGAPCNAPVAVIGADVTPANLPLVRGALGVGPGTTELRETLADERARAHGLISPALLGIVAVSSVLLRVSLGYAEAETQTPFRGCHRTPLTGTAMLRQESA